MYCKEFNTVFVHIPKTGGQSIEHVFLARLGLTWQDRAAILMRQRGPGEPGPTRLAHLFAREYVEFGYLSADVFADAFKFTVVRNPYDRALSQYRYRTRNRPATFESFIALLAENDESRHLMPQADFVLDNSGQPLVDRIIRFEQLADEFAEMSKRIFGKRVELEHHNKSPDAIGPEALDTATRRIIHKRYEQDFDLFRYPAEL